MRSNRDALRFLVLFAALLIGSVFLLLPRHAHAVPSYARQTGLACEACHTVFPELTPFGRLFKLNGYVFENVKQVSDINQQKTSTLSLNELPPISIMMMVSETHLDKALPDEHLPTGFSQNDTIEFPQQLSIFYAGRIAENFGAFLQLTYAPDANSIGIDNSDLRFADTGQVMSSDLIYGLSLNNNPTVQDVWQGTPAWGFPYASTNAAPAPAAQALIDGTLAQDVGGMTGYVMIDKTYYAEVGGYRSAKIGFQAPSLPLPNVLNSEATGTINGIAPYWRLAWQREWEKNSLEFGTYGLYASMRPGNGFSVTSGPTDKFIDVAADGQYQWIGEDHLFTLNGTWIHENSIRDASFAEGFATNKSDDLNTLRATATYYYERRYGASVQLFSTSGSKDLLLYGSGTRLVGSANGNPDTRGARLELNYVPWLNTKISLQYTAYSLFDGKSQNYDGFGRSAGDNNSLYLLLWVSF